MSDALGYMLLSHEEHYGENRVLIMNDDDIQAEIAKQKKSSVAPAKHPNALIAVHAPVAVRR